MPGLITRFVGFAGTGAIATGIQYTILILLHELLGAPAVIASALGYAIAAVSNYLMKYHWVFASDAHHRVAGPRYALVSLTGLGLNTLLMYLATETLGLYYLLAQVISTLIVLLWNFTANSLWTFGSQPDARPPDPEQKAAAEPPQQRR